MAYIYARCQFPIQVGRLYNKFFNVLCCSPHGFTKSQSRVLNFPQFFNCLIRKEFFFCCSNIFIFFAITIWFAKTLVKIRNLGLEIREIMWWVAQLSFQCYEFKNYECFYCNFKFHWNFKYFGQYINIKYRQLIVFTIRILLSLWVEFLNVSEVISFLGLILLLPL